MQSDPMLASMHNEHRELCRMRGCSENLLIPRGPDRTCLPHVGAWRRECPQTLTAGWSETRPA